jgi:hypothetical protein
MGARARDAMTARFGRATLATALAALPVAAVLVLVLRELGHRALHVPRDLPSLQVPELVPAIIMPVAGTALGYFLSYRKPSRISLATFLAGSAVFTAIAIAITVGRITPSSSAAVGITVAIDIAPAIVAAAALLSFGPARRESA